MLVSKRILQGASLGIWEISESLEILERSVSLDHDERKKYAALKTENRKKEMLATLALIRELTTNGKIKIIYNEAGKPFLKDSPENISISHTKNFAAVIIDKKETGIDIQHLDPKIERIAHKFMSETELKSLADSNRTEQLSVYWCAKESLYKLYGRKNLEFKKNLLIDPFEYKRSGRIRGKIITEQGEQQYALWYEVDKETMLVYVLNG